MTTRRVCLVGAGYIAQVHAEALASLPGVRAAAVVDPNPEAAQALARRFGIGAVHESVTAAIAAGGFDCAHVLVPPAAHHAAAAPFLRAGLPVLVEKPMATTAADALALNALAAAGGTTVAVNQNFIFHPAFRRLAEAVERRALGRLSAVQVLYSMPLRQLQSRQFGHWMFQAPLNILLEQAVHPLSEIAALVGDWREVRASAAPPIEIAPGQSFFNRVNVDLLGGAVPAQLHFAVGGAFPCQLVTAVCDDGVLQADLHNNRLLTTGRGRWLEAADMLVSGTAGASGLAGDALRNAVDYGLSLLRLRPRSDAFFQGMRASIEHFHAALSAGTAPRHSGAFGLRLVEACEAIAAAAFPARPPAPRLVPVAAAAGADVAVLGGTGFIGQATVAALLAQGRRVAVMARGIANLPATFHDPRVSVLQGDVRRAGDVERAVAGVPLVVNLAHGGGGGNWAEVERSMVGSARLVAEAVVAHGAKRLVHVGSIAALYLGDAATTVTGATPVDARAELRAEYARGKAETDRMLLEMHRREGLALVILRPGVVVGAGGSPFHSGLGFFNNEQHCLGWNRGRNPLPFVLAEDVAAAIVGALEAPGIEGRCYNLVGDARPSAQAYVAALAAALERPLRFHPQSIWKLQGIEIGKWLVKRAVGRAAPFPSYRDLLSRGLAAGFDCADAKRDLGWTPVGDHAEFVRRAIAVHRAG